MRKLTEVKTMEAKTENSSATIWEKIQARVQSVPQSELAKVPSDAAAQHDHYLYGTPKKIDAKPKAPREKLRPVAVTGARKTRARKTA